MANKHDYVTKNDGGGFALIAATLIVILVMVGLLFSAGAIPPIRSEQPVGTNSAQDTTPKTGSD
jgi:hypothetical protein